MADAPVVHIGENSPEYVAFQLAEKIWNWEGHAKDRAAFLNLYSECLHAVKGLRNFKQK
jgi:hypothetical protein